MFAKRPMTRLVFTSFMLIALFFTSLGITPAYAAGITVNTAVDELTTNGLCSLREAIVNANSNTGTRQDCASGFGIDTITFAGNYTITLAGAQLPVVTSETIIKGNGSGNTTIQANANPNTATYRVFQVGANTGDLTLDSLTVRHGRCDGSCLVGGGIQVESAARLKILNSIISGNYSIDGGAGIFTGSLTSLTITNSIISGNSTPDLGGGVFSIQSFVRITNSTLSGNTGFNGGGIYSGMNTIFITNSTLSGNTGFNGGGIYSGTNTIFITNSTISGNTAANGGGIYSLISPDSALTVTNSTISGNSVTNAGGGIYNEGSPDSALTVTDSTISGNNANLGGGVYNNSTASLNIKGSTLYGNSAGTGGAIYSDGELWLANSTISGNEAYDYGGGIYTGGIASISSSTIVFNTLIEGTNLGAGGIDGNASLYNSIVAGNTRLLTSQYRDCSGTMYMEGINLFWDMTNCSRDPASPGYSGQLLSLNELGPLQNNGGPTWTHALLTIEGESRAIDAGNDEFCASSAVNNLDQRGVTRPQGSHCDVGAYEAGGIKVNIGGVELSDHALASTESTRVSLPGVNNGPIQIINRNGDSLIAAERVIYKVNGTNTSFTEMMGLPNGQLSTTYWLPWYNNADLDTQLRFGNVSGSTATVRVYIGGTEMTSGCTSSPSLPYPYVLGNGASIRVSCGGVNNGPVKIQSTGNIVAAERVIYKVNGTNTSFSEMMGLPDHLRDTTYWLPWYNNADLDTQLRFGNVSGSAVTLRVYIGGTEMTSGCTSSPSLPYPYVLENGASIRVSCAGVNNGPVKIQSTGDIVAAERVIYKVNGTNTSFTEVMGLPNNLLHTTYWLPWYNNADLDTQLRFGNVSGSTATVRVYIGGTEMTSGCTSSPSLPYPYVLGNGASIRVSCSGVNNGPVKIVSNRNIVAAERVIYKVNGTNTSFSEMMGLPAGQLSTSYWFPWYNNADLDTQLRFGVP